MPLRYKNLLILTAVLAGGVLLTGCDESQRYGQGSIGQTRPSYTVSMNELASKLGLSMRKAGSPYFELGNAKNTVRLFMYQGGHVYVNGKSVASVSNVTEISGQYYVPELLVPKIRSHLIPANSLPPPVYQPYQPPKRYGSGLVVIDPGHGGTDPGAISYLGYHEKVLNLKIARKLAAYLRQAGVKVVMTRDSDVYPTLEERAALANRLNADLFVSVHNNTNHTRNTRGYTVYIARSASRNSKKVGRAIEGTMGRTGLRSLGMRNEDYRVLKNTKCPAVLVECGHISNPSEAALLEDARFQDKIARAIADGILEYL